MNRSMSCLLIASALVGCPKRAPDRSPPPEAKIESSFIRDAVAELASDEMNGRGPGTAGDKSARAALRARLEAMGYAPGAADGSWEQPFPIVGVKAEVPKTWKFSGAEGEASFDWWEDFIAASGVQEEEVSVQDAEVVFVGYGIEAPEENWDDFGDADLKGKLLLVLNDDPNWDPALFGGARKLYYGRWTYKYESAARQGAAGAIIIHTTPSAGYPWRVVQNSWSGWQFGLPAAGEPRVAIHAWVTEDAAKQLVALGGKELDDLVAAAKKRDFAPVSLGVTASLTMKNAIERTETANVLGVLPGSDPELAQQAVVLTAHHDHLGTGEPDDTGDVIYNGARDNAVAMGQLLAIADALASGARPKRSILVAFVGAEEQGLLGSLFYARAPTFAPGRIAANLNFELGDIWGLTEDIVVTGAGKNSLEDDLRRIAEARGVSISEVKDPAAGWYYRSDQLSFARIGVPALWFRPGTKYVGKPAGWGEQVQRDWIGEYYHRPGDELADDWNFDGAARNASLAHELIVEIANRAELPTWKPGDEFEDEREAALEAVR